MQTATHTETIIVTGASGLVGSHILKELSLTDARIIAVCRHVPVNADARFEWLQGDILDTVFLEEAFTDVDKIYHCAALVSYDTKRRKKIFQTNIDGTANVVNAALNCNVKRLLYVSSVAAIGESEESRSVNEETLWKDDETSDYAKSKHYAEMEVWRGISEGLNAAIINPSIIIGCGDWDKGSTEIFKNIYNGFPWYSNGTHGFVDVNDVAKAAVTLMNSELNAQRFIINGVNISYRELFYEIADAFGVKRPNKEVTPLLAETVWRANKLKSFFTGKSSMITKHSTRVAMANIVYDNEKFLKSFPEFTYTDIKISLQNITDSLKNKYELK